MVPKGMSAVKTRKRRQNTFKGEVPGNVPTGLHILHTKRRRSHESDHKKLKLNFYIYFRNETFLVFSKSPGKVIVCDIARLVFDYYKFNISFNSNSTCILYDDNYRLL